MTRPPNFRLGQCCGTCQSGNVHRRDMTRWYCYRHCCIVPQHDLCDDWVPEADQGCATIDLYGPPRYARGMTDGTSASSLDWRGL